ncbi:hypothetical protein CDD81_7488 [Ophiocordyceps australis]|uniref:Aldose 1-epimerase n=1 Tax=Ophiocordyceps australis TaxID=1399860 RepID=A0A2C5YFN9_9HYPO|nr:hypothetical protein CDD81_7488 [Ophiocordyceps australis]
MKWWTTILPLLAALGQRGSAVVQAGGTGGSGGSGGSDYGSGGSGYGSDYGSEGSGSGGSGSGGSSSSKTLGPDKDGKYWIYGQGLAAAFVPYGASISNLILSDRQGVERDVVGGFDNASYYSMDKQHPHFGGVPGRYANRIRNSTFSIGEQTFHVAPNENGGRNTLHGGPDGWDWRNFSVVSHTPSAITFSLVDAAGKEGFPGEVVSLVTYALRGRSWDMTMMAMATTDATPIMLSSHTYWNLDGFANTDTNLVLNHSMHMPYSGQRIEVDNILIPTGNIVANLPGSVNDFWSRPKQIGASFDHPDMPNNCGFNCTGYDNCFTVDRAALGPYDWRTQGPVATLSSQWSGIQLDVYTNQHAMQMYSCSGMNGSMALKTTQGTPEFPRTIPKYGCLVLEVQDYIDGINHPEWMRKQIYGPSDAPYVLQATYTFSLLSEP